MPWNTRFLAVSRAWIAALLLVAAALAGACDGSEEPVCSGERLFGRPVARTGLDDARCGPTCTCHGAAFEAPAYGDAEADALLRWALVEPYPVLAVDPYEAAAPGAPPADGVCAVVRVEDQRYRLESFASMEAATRAGAMPTHGGACGVCSTLADLAVYMRYPDLTAPVRQCGLDSADQDEDVACLRRLGFTEPCAQIWAFNTAHTRDHCLLECLSALNAPYHREDGSLNDCLVCDEVQSGPVFKALAGRTRRNTGIASAMCRSCEEVLPIVHVYE
jgi:hypothetical protein